MFMGLGLLLLLLLLLLLMDTGLTAFIQSTLYCNTFCNIHGHSVANLPVPVLFLLIIRLSLCSWKKSNDIFHLCDCGVAFLAKNGIYDSP